jgi:hypothetical protein
MSIGQLLDNQFFQNQLNQPFFNTVNLQGNYLDFRLANLTFSQ